MHILNLLSESKPGEAELTRMYRYHVQNTPSKQVVEMSGASENRLLDSQFDFHAETKGPAGYEAASMVKRLIQDRADSFGYFLSEAQGQSDIKHDLSESTKTAVILQQEGVFRTNCLDCLDRTNLVQTIISQMALEQFLDHRGERSNADFWMRHSSLWADSGDVSGISISSSAVLTYIEGIVQDLCWNRGVEIILH